MRKTVWGACIAMVVGAVVSASATAAPPAIGSPAPEIQAQFWLNSPPLTLKALRGKIVVVEFWATWCPPCRQSIPHLIELNKEYGPKGVVFIGMTDEDKSKIEPFAKQMGMNYVVAGGSQTAGQYGVSGIPTAFVIDTAGNVAWGGHPMDKGFVDALEEQLKKAPPKTTSTSPASLDDVTSALQHGQYGRAATLLERIEVPEGNAAVKSRVERIKKTLLDKAPARLTAGEKALATKEYYKASEAFEDVALMAPGSPQAEKAAEHLKALMADDAIKAEIDKGREKAAADSLANALKLEKKASPVATVKALEELVERFPGTQAAEEAAKKLETLNTKETPKAE